MNKHHPNHGETWKHMGTDIVYVVDYPGVNMKDGNTRWIPGIVYSREGQVYCRSLASFLKSFQRVDVVR
jgi:hypothetical protein